MSDSDVEVIREVNDAVATGELRAVVQRLHPDVVWEHNIGAGSPLKFARGINALWNRGGLMYAPPLR